MPPKAKETPTEESAITMADVAALNQPAADTEVTVKQAEVKVFVSEGMRHDIEIHGFAVDPNTGRRVTRADIGVEEPAAEAAEPEPGK